MEFEIADDPQGLPDLPDGDRDGGLEEDPAMLRKSARHQGIEETPQSGNWRTG